MLNKITKKSFVTTLTNNPSWFAGLLGSNYVYRENDIIQAYNNFIINQQVPMRQAKKFSNGLRFSDDSVLEVGDVDATKRVCYTIGNKVFILEQTYTSPYDGQKTVKAMIYFVR